MKHPVDVMSPVHGAVTQAFVIAAIPEEIAKFAAIFYAIKRYGSGEDRHDMITPSFAVALGFAAIENLAYLVAPGEWPLLAASRAVLAVPTLMLITRNQAFFGVLPAWFLMVVLSTICVLCLCNKVRASAERVYVPLDGASSPRLTGAVLLLLVPILAGITLVSAGDFGIVGAAVFSILPAILGMDLLCTSSNVSPATTAKR
jgi:hypothetical protein